MEKSENIICIQCEKPSPHQYSLKCNHHLCSKCLTRALFLTSFKGIAELNRIHIVCNCKNSKTELQTEDIVAFLQRANGIQDPSSLKPSKTSFSGLQHKLYLSFLKNIDAIEGKYFDECTDDYEMKKQYISNAITQLTSIGANIKLKFDKAFDRAKRFFMLLKLSLYDNYNTTEEELSELIHVDDIQFKSNLADEYDRITSIAHQLKNKKEFSTYVVLNKLNVATEKQKKEENFKWLFCFKAEKTDMLANLRLNRGKSERKIMKVKQMVNIDIDNLIINDFSNSVYDMMKVKEKDIYKTRFKKINTDFRWVSKVIEEQYHPRGKAGLLKEMSRVSSVEFKPREKVVGYQQGDCFSLGRVYQRYEQNAVCSDLVVEVGCKKRRLSEVHNELGIEIRSRKITNMKNIETQGDSFELIHFPTRKEVVYCYDPLLKQLLVRKEFRVIESKTDIVNQKDNKEKRCIEALTKEELLSFFKSINFLNKSFDHSLMMNTSFIPFSYDIPTSKRFDNKLISPVLTTQLDFSSKPRLDYQLNHSFFFFNKQIKRFTQSPSLNQISYHSAIRRFPISSFILETSQFLINRRPILIPQPSNQTSLTILSLKYFIKEKQLLNSTASFTLSPLPFFRKEKQLLSNALAFAISSMKGFMKEKLLSSECHSFHLPSNYHCNKSHLQKLFHIESSTQSFHSQKMLSPVQIETINPFSLINTSKVKRLEVKSINQFSFPSDHKKTLSKHSSKSVSSRSDEEVLYLNQPNDMKSIQQYRNSILSSLSQSSFQIELIPHLERESLAKTTFSSKFTPKSSMMKQSSMQKASNKRNQPVILKASSSQNKEKKDRREPNVIAVNTNVSKQPLAIDSSTSEKSKSTKKVKPYTTLFIDKEAEAQEKPESPKTDQRKDSLTLSLSEDKELISNINGNKLYEQYTLSLESTGGMNQIKDSSVNRLSEEEIAVMNEIIHPQANPFKANYSKTPKGLTKRHLDEGLTTNEYSSPIQKHKDTNPDNDEDIDNPSRCNTSNVLSVNKSSSFQYKHFTQAIKKTIKGASIPSLSLILHPSNAPQSQPGIKRCSSFSPNDDSTALNKGIKSLIQISDDTVVICCNDSPDIVVIKHTDKGSIEEKEEKRVFSKHTQRVNMVISLPDDQIASCSADSSILIWNMLTYQSDKGFIDKNKGDILCLVYLSGSKLAFASFWTLSVWDFDNEVVLFNLIGHNKSITSIVKLSEDHIASSSLDSTVKLWSLNQKKELNSIFASKNFISAMVSISSKRIALGMADNSIKIFNALPVKEIASLMSHKAQVVYLLKIHRTSLASSSKDLSICIWNLRLFSLETRLERLSIGTCLALTRSGKLLVASEDSSIEEVIIDTQPNDKSEGKAE